MALLFALPVHQDPNATNKTNDFSMEYVCTSRRLSIEIEIKDLNVVFLEKSELLQYQRNSKQNCAF